MENNDKPLISIVVVTYNQKEFIRDCVDSIISQDYPNKEIIIADDCSTDGTRDICIKYSEKYPWLIKLAMAEANQGVTKNTNSGLALCNGRLVCLTGGDDIFMPGKLSAQANWFLENPTGSICTSDIEIFNSETGKTIYIHKSREFRNGGPARKIITQRNQPPSSNFMINRELCSDLIFDERTPIVSDWLFFTEACLRGKIGYINDILMRYRRHSKNITSSGSAKSYLDDRLIYTDLLIYKYPRFFRAYKIQRANIFFEAAKRDFFSRNYKLARIRAWTGIGEYKFDFRNWILFFATVFGNRAHKIAIRFKTE